MGSQPPPLFDLYCYGLAYVKEEFWPTLFGPADTNYTPTHGPRHEARNCQQKRCRITTRKKM